MLYEYQLIFNERNKRHKTTAMLNERIVGMRVKSIFFSMFDANQTIKQSHSIL